MHNLVRSHSHMYRYVWHKFRHTHTHNMTTHTCTHRDRKHTLKHLCAPLHQTKTTCAFALMWKIDFDSMESRAVRILSTLRVACDRSTDRPTDQHTHTHTHDEAGESRSACLQCAACISAHCGESDYGGPQHNSRVAISLRAFRFCTRECVCTMCICSKLNM